jgi:hypothetical protein
VLAGAALSFSTIWIDTVFDDKLVPEWLTGGTRCGAGDPVDGRRLDGVVGCAGPDDSREAH